MKVAARPGVGARMRFAVLLAAALLGGCELVGFYRNETAGISPATLVPLYFQEKQYVTDRGLEAKVRAALAAQGMTDVEVDVYLEEVTLKGRERQREHALATVQDVYGVKSVRYEAAR